MFAPALPELFAQSWNETIGDDLPPWAINRGWCYQFAMVLYMLAHAMGKRPVFVQTHNHAWVEIDGVHYDSENLKGAAHALSPWGPKRVQLRDALEFWANNGRSGRVRFDVVKKTLTKAGIGAINEGNQINLGRS